MNAADLQRLVRRAFALPPHVVVSKAAAMARRRMAAQAERRADARHSTFAVQAPERLERLLAVPDSLPGGDAFDAACELYLSHRFDILGSGWVDAGYGTPAPGVEGHRYESPEVSADTDGAWLAGRVPQASLAEAQRRWRLVSAGYRPIDWQADVRSGYRWSGLTWFKDATYGDVPGADVKVPWELSRAHHLPQLALWAAGGDRERLDRVAREVCDEILDFSATNPPRFGPNWFVTMDVGIRVANWCVAIDLLRAAGAELDPAVEAAIAASVYEHAAFIAGNLEWFPDMRSNHYLGNIAGLAFAAAYLPSSPEADSWLSFSAAALLQEAGNQFEPDGGNFEGSTAYHRLSFELLLWGVAVLRALPAEKAGRIGAWDPVHVPVPEPPTPVDAAALAAPELDELFVRTARFGLDVTRPDRRIVQFGDCDSGRLFKLSPVLRLKCAEELRGLLENLDGWTPPADAPAGLPLEEHLDVRHLAAAVGALTGCAALENAAGDPVEAAVMRALVAGRPEVGDTSAAGDRLVHALSGAGRVRVGDDAAFVSAVEAAGDALTRRFEAPAGFLGGLELAGYPDFGVWVWRAEGLYLAVRCGSVGQYGAAGHVHNDQLAMELWLGGRPVVSDPGTYAYTHLPHRRNEYRSVASHDAPRLDGAEPGLLTHGLFQIEGARPGVCAYFGERGFVGHHDGYRKRLTRVIELTEDAVIVRDVAEGGGRIDVAAAVPTYSPGYGMRLRAGDGILDRFLGIDEAGESR